MLFREFARSLFGRLRSPRRRVIAERQLKILDILLNAGTGPMRVIDLTRQIDVHYTNLKFSSRAQIRDIVGLLDLNAIELENGRIAVDLHWPQRFSESEVLERYENMPSAVSANHPAMTSLSQLLGRPR